MDIREYLTKNRLITDGAMGTYFDGIVDSEDSFVESANETNKQLVMSIHLEYINAGARLIRTNTFATNTMFFDSIDNVVSNIKDAYTIAKQAVLKSGENVFIGADIGPIYDSIDKEYADVLNEYKIICDTFLDEGANIFVFETQSELTYIEEISKYIKEKKENAFILVQFSFNKTKHTKLGLSISRMIANISKVNEIDAYGFNCGVAPTHMYDFLKNIEFPNNKFISALPNVSYPSVLRGKTVYSDNVIYYQSMMEKISQLGIEIIGGCCGTTPKHIKVLHDTLADVPVAQKKISAVKEDDDLHEQEFIDNKLISKIDAGEKIFVVELDPPFNADDSKVINGASILANNADIITLADSPLARPRMDAISLAIKVQNKCNVKVMPHICCRDKNLIGLRSTILGAYTNEIRNALIITGDPIARGDREKITSVFDFNSIKLMQYISEMNEELFAEDPIYFGGALNYHGVNVDKIIERMNKKIQAGARYFLTQPVYSNEDIERVKYIKTNVNTSIFCGIMPLVSYKNANFIKNEMPGINVPDDVVSMYKEDMTRDEFEKVAVLISTSIADRLYDFVDGFYFMTPFNRVSLINNIINEIKIKHEKI